jgi:hypothetical protein
LFQNPFGRIEILSDSYFTQLIVYIHRNPQKHGLIQDFRKWRYSSYNALLSSQATHIQRDRVLGWFGGIKGFEFAHTSQADDPRIAHLVGED